MIRLFTIRYPFSTLFIIYFLVRRVAPFIFKRVFFANKLHVNNYNSKTKDCLDDFIDTAFSKRRSVFMQTVKYLILSTYLIFKGTPLPKYGRREINKILDKIKNKRKSTPASLF